MTLYRLLRIGKHRLQSLFRKEELDGQLDEELLLHFELLVQENIEAGMSADAARIEAKRTLGNSAMFMDECRDERRVTWFHDFLQDVRYGLRMMRKHPGVTAIAAISLALGIGANTAILSVGTSVLLGTLPVPNADRLVILRTAREPRLQSYSSVPEYIAWKERNQSFESMGVSIANQQDLGADDVGHPPQRLAGQAITPSLFQTLNVQPMLGRVFLDGDAPFGRVSTVIVLSHRLWQRNFDSDPHIVGKQIQLNGRAMTIVGVMPKGFWYPVEDSDYWVPLTFTRAQLQGSARLFMVTARLKPGTTIAQAKADVVGIAGQLAREYPERQPGWNPFLIPLRQFWLGWTRGPLLMLEGAVALVLLIACANVATLLLGRIPARREEVFMRVMMGADRGRIVRQFLTESMLLSLIGGALGLLVAWWGVSILKGLDPPPAGITLTGVNQPSGLFGFAALISVLSSLLFGSLPALAAFSSTNETRQPNVRASRRSASDILVSVQVGLALMLLISAGLLTNSFIRLLRDDRGFDPNGVLTFDYRIPIEEYSRPLDTYRGMPAIDATPPTQAMQRVYERLRSVPGIESVAASSARPVNGMVLPRATVLVSGRPVPADASEREKATVTYFLVTERFFGTMSTPIVRGRNFSEEDMPTSPWVAVINEAMARRFWPDENPVGKFFSVEAISGERPRQVVGIARDVPLRYVRDPQEPPQPIAYTLYIQQPERYQGPGTGQFGQMTFFVRSSVDPLSLVPALQRAAAEVDSKRPLANFQVMTDFLGSTIRAKRFYVYALAAFSFMATILAGVGVYGVMSYSVSQRTREIGIRMGMGATRRDIVEMVAGKALRSVGLGLLFGILGSLLPMRLIEFQLWGVSPTDPATFISVTILLLGVSMAACFIPARRAMRMDPSVALRTE